jgi:hypothetical protein
LAGSKRRVPVQAGVWYGEQEANVCHLACVMRLGLPASLMSVLALLAGVLIVVGR